MSESQIDQHVAAVRGFNRFYTRLIGVLQEGLLESPFSLAEVRVLYELAQREQATATALGAELGLDAGYLSRILRALGKRALITRRRSPADARQSHLSLTRKGAKAFAELDARSRRQVYALLDSRHSEDRARLVAAMSVIEEILGGTGGNASRERALFLIRAHQPGDIGWVVHRHGVLYAQEYGWDERFEALVAAIVADFIQKFEPKRERCWIAERDGGIVGSVFLMQKSKTVAKLRLLYVEPKARGLGIGRRLIAECLRFARQSGYRKVTLWTNSVLHAARHLYEEAGFILVKEEPHHSFGHDLVGQTWELAL